MESTNQIFENLRLELRRGCLILAVLGTLRTEQYGYTMRKSLAEHGLAADEGTLYPLLRRLETQGLLLSQWREEDKRNKRFYRLSAEGEAILQKLLAEWQRINASVNGIVEGKFLNEVEDGTGKDETGQESAGHRTGRAIPAGR